VIIQLSLIFGRFPWCYQDLDSDCPRHTGFGFRLGFSVCISFIILIIFFWQLSYDIESLLRDVEHSDDIWFDISRASFYLLNSPNFKITCGCLFIWRFLDQLTFQHSLQSRVICRLNSKFPSLSDLAIFLDGTDWTDVTLDHIFISDRSKWLIDFIRIQVYICSVFGILAATIPILTHVIPGIALYGWISICVAAVVFALITKCGQGFQMPKMQERRKFVRFDEEDQSSKEVKMHPFYHALQLDLESRIVDEFNYTITQVRQDLEVLHTFVLTQQNHSSYLMTENISKGALERLEEAQGAIAHLRSAIPEDVFDQMCSEVPMDIRAGAQMLLSDPRASSSRSYSKISEILLNMEEEEDIKNSLKLKLYRIAAYNHAVISRDQASDLRILSQVASAVVNFLNQQKLYLDETGLEDMAMVYLQVYGLCRVYNGCDAKNIQEEVASFNFLQMKNEDFAVLLYKIEQELENIGPDLESFFTSITQSKLFLDELSTLLTEFRGFLETNHISAHDLQELHFLMSNQTEMEELKGYGDILETCMRIKSLSSLKPDYLGVLEMQACIDLDAVICEIENRFGSDANFRTLLAEECLSTVWEFLQDSGHNAWASEVQDALLDRSKHIDASTFPLVIDQYNQFVKKQVRDFLRSMAFPADTNPLVDNTHVEIARALVDIENKIPFLNHIWLYPTLLSPSSEDAWLEAFPWSKWRRRLTQLDANIQKNLKDEQRVACILWTAYDLENQLREMALVTRSVMNTRSNLLLHELIAPIDLGKYTRNTVAAAIIFTAVVFLGNCMFHFFEGENYLDSFFNAYSQRSKYNDFFLHFSFDDLSTFLRYAFYLFL